MSLLTFLTHFADPRVEETPAPPTISDIRAIAVVVDDDPGMRSLMSLSLQQVGYQVIAVANADDAIRKTQMVGRLDLVVADLELHDADGPAVVDALRAISGYMPVVYVSDYRQGLVGVADPVLRKPFMCGEWLRAVASVVGVLPKDKLLAA